MNGVAKKPGGPSFRNAKAWRIVCGGKRYAIKKMRCAGIALFAVTALQLAAQQPTPVAVPGELPPRGQTSMGTVPTRDALVTGGLEVHGDTARLLSNDSITAYDHAAAISLARGGDVDVCATSQFHLLHSGTESSLLFGLDRGAIEIHSVSEPQDVILTPDIRFTIELAGRYDLRLRVTPNGDTCVENSGTAAPVLTLADPFSGATYRLIPGQHVLFEHGDLHQVVDNERSPCGCPTTTPPQQLATTTTSATTPTSPSTAAVEHPFPAAASVGLAPTPSPAREPAPAGQQRTQVSTVFTYDANHPNAVPPSTVEPPKPASPTASTSTTGSPSGTGDTTSATPPPTPPGAHDLFHAIGHFFHKLFHHENKPAPSPQ